MRYATGEDTTLLGTFKAGTTVNIQVLDLKTDNLVNITSSVCTESNKVPGLYQWTTSNINDPAIVGYRDMFYRMTDAAGNTFDGKFVYGGYTDMSVELKAVGFNTDEILRILKIINMLSA